MFAATDVAGAGGVALGGPPARWMPLKRLFGLDAHRAGGVLASGRPTLGHLRGAGGDASWLAGFAMSYRLAAIEGRSFDERLTGSSFGEDLDFSFRLARDHRLVICPDASTRHHHSPLNRMDPRRSARHRTAATHRWVLENRERGMRRRAFWWSVVGDTVLRLAAGVAGPTAARAAKRQTARGNIDGVRDVVRGRPPC